MVNWKKLATVLGLTAAVAFTMTGCGGAKKEEAPAASTEAASSEAAEEETEASVEEDAEATEADDEEVQGGEILDSWTLDTIVDADGNEQTLAEYAEAQGVDMKGMEAVVTFNDDGTCTTDIGGVKVEGTYTYDGETIETDYTASGGTTGSFFYDAENDRVGSEDANTGMTAYYTRGDKGGTTVEDLVEEGMATDGAAADASAIVGDWALTIIEDAEGNQYSLAEYAAEQGVDVSGMETTYTFNEDGTVVGALGGVGVEGTYTFDGTEVTVDFTEAGGTAATFSYDAQSGYLMASDANSGITSYMEKQ